MGVCGWRGAGRLICGSCFRLDDVDGTHAAVAHHHALAVDVALEILAYRLPLVHCHVDGRLRLGYLGLRICAFLGLLRLSLHSLGAHLLKCIAAYLGSLLFELRNAPLGIVAQTVALDDILGGSDEAVCLDGNSIIQALLQLVELGVNLTLGPC